MPYKLENWKCSVCQENITEVKGIEDFDEVKHKTFFEIERSRRELQVYDGEIEEELKNRNVKMNRWICENCFVKILNESKTLGNLFYDKKENKFIY
ncbi:MAG: hypothetical protein AABY22_15155 [Nanoarchaeota archaeon]